MRRTSLSAYALQWIRRWIEEAAGESGYGPVPEIDEADIRARPIAFDPRFGLEPWPGTPLLIDLLEADLRAAGTPVDLRAALRRGGLEAELARAETVGDFLAILERAVADEWTS